MNNPEPLRQKPKDKTNRRVAIFALVSLHAVFFAGLIIQGCKRDETKSPSRTTESPASESLRLPDTNSSETSLSKGRDVTSNAASLNVVPKPVSEIMPPILATAPPKGEIKTYTVARGDTLLKLARANRVSVSAITQANANLDPAKLKVGQKIQIPISSAGGGSIEPGKIGGSATPRDGNVHVVKAGETLTRIAKQRHTTAKAIQVANDLKSARLLVGQKLKLPAPAQSTLSAESAKKSSVVSTNNPAHLNR